MEIILGQCFLIFFKCTGVLENSVRWDDQCHSYISSLNVSTKHGDEQKPQIQSNLIQSANQHLERCVINFTFRLFNLWKQIKCKTTICSFSSGLSKEIILHNSVDPQCAYRLYGLCRWVGDLQRWWSVDLLPSVNQASCYFNNSPWLN